MANPNPTGKKPKGAVELVQRTRAAVLNAFDCLDQRGKKISEILADEAEKNPIKFMELASKYIPREILGNVQHNHEHNHTHVAVSEVDKLLSEFTEASKGRSDKKTNTH